MTNPFEPQAAQAPAQATADTASQPVVSPPATEVAPQFDVFTPAAVVPPVATPPGGMPMQQPLPQQPAPKRGGVVVLAIVAVLLLGAAGAFGALYVSEKNMRAEQVAAKEREIADLTKKAKDSEELATKATDERRTAQNAQKRAEEEGARLVKCRDASRSMTAAGIEQSEAKAAEAFKNILLYC